VQPAARYARLGEDRIAYQVLGEGPPDLIVFDRRGTGASDPQPPGSLPPWESYGQDLTAVLDEVGSQQAALLAQLDASPMALFFAGTRPERTRALILANAAAKFLAADDYPIGVPPEVAEALLAQFDQLWGTEAMAAMFAPSRAGDQRFCRWLARFQRAVASPRVVQAFLRANLEMDARPILPLIQAPTLVLHRRDYQFIPIANGRYLAEHISGARVVELDGTEQSLFWETPEAVLDHIERFLTGMRRGVQPTRTLATVLFTDIVSSTERAEELGDRRWRELLNVHDELTGRVVEEFSGRLVKTTGDGILATFDGPGRARRDPGLQDRARPRRRRRRHPGGPRQVPAQGPRRRLAAARRRTTLTSTSGFILWVLALPLDAARLVGSSNRQRPRTGVDLDRR